MEQLSTLIRSYIALEQSSLESSPIPASLATGLSSKEWRLIDIVRELGEYLLSEVDATRARGVGLLSAVVQHVDKKSLDRQSTKTLTTFFVDKLADLASTIPAVTALTGLTESPNFGVGEGMEVAKAVFAGIKLLTFPQSTRYLVYTLFDSLMSRSRPALKRMGKDFVGGYCNLVEGEKDPRNLMLSFSIIRVIVVEFEIAENINDLFDITFCYFPITFSPPPDDPYGITSDDLVRALRGCLAGTPLFGPLALPLFLDKMQAASDRAKRQTLQALIACFPIYGAGVCGEWAGRFSEALSIEIFHATDDATMELSLVAFQSLFSTLYPDALPISIRATTVDEDGDAEMEVAAPAPTGVEGVGVKVVSNSLEELREPDKSNAKPAVKILAALINSSNRLAAYTLSLALPQLLAIYKNPDEMSLRPPVLTCLSTLLESLSPTWSATSTPDSALQSSFSRPILSHQNGTSPLEPFRDDLLSIFSSGSRSQSSRSASLEGLVNLIKIPTFLTPTEVAYCVSSINHVLSSPETEDEYDVALDALVEITPLHPAVVEESTLPILFAHLPSEGPIAGSKGDEGYRRALAALAELCISPTLFEILSLRILARLDAVCALGDDGEEEGKRNSLYAHHLLSTLRAVLKEKVKAGHEDVPKYVEKMVPRLFGLFILPTTEDRMETGKGKTVAMDSRLVVDAGKVITIVVQRLGVKRQTSFSEALNSAFHDGSLKLLLDEEAKQAGPTPFKPLLRESPSAQQDTIALVSAAILAQRPAVPITSSDLLGFLRHFLKQTLFVANETQLESVSHLLGSTINKRAQELAEFVDVDTLSFWEANVLVPTAPVATRRRALRAFAWIAKGLVVRSDQRGYDFVGKLLEVFHDPVLGKDAALALGAIADESDRVLSKENFAVIRLLYKQRFFSFLLPKLVAGHKTSSGAAQAVYLVALSVLLQHIPKQMSLTELPKLLPLLITSLDLPDPALRANVVETLGVLTKEVPKQVESAVSGIAVKVLSGLAADRASGKGTVKLRLASLDFLGVLPAHVPYLILHPQKATILRELGQAVDDPRREVRRAAVDCRGKWFLYSG